MSDAADRVMALTMGRDLSRPECVGDELWDVPVGEIRLEVVIPPCGCDYGDCTAMNGEYRTAECPACGTSEDLHLMGRWTGPVTCRCPECGDTWRLVPGDPDTETYFMRRAITEAVKLQGNPRFSRSPRDSSPSDRPSAPSGRRTPRNRPSGTSPTRSRVQ